MIRTDLWKKYESGAKKNYKLFKPWRKMVGICLYLKYGWGLGDVPEGWDREMFDDGMYPIEAAHYVFCNWEM